MTIELRATTILPLGDQVADDAGGEGLVTELVEETV